MQLSQPLYTDADRQQSLYTCVHVHRAQKHRRCITRIAHVRQLSNNHLYMIHMHKNIHAHRNTHDKYTPDHMLQAHISTGFGIQSPKPLFPDCDLQVPCGARLSWPWPAETWLVIRIIPLCKKKKENVSLILHQSATVGSVYSHHQTITSGQRAFSPAALVLGDKG